jgi:hypothetical protein
VLKYLVDGLHKIVASLFQSEPESPIEETPRRTQINFREYGDRKCPAVRALLVWEEMAKNGIFSAECPWGVIANPGGSDGYSWGRATTYQDLCFAERKPFPISGTDGWVAVIGIGSKNVEGDDDEFLAMVCAAYNTHGETSYAVAELSDWDWMMIDTDELDRVERGPHLRDIHEVKDPILEIDPTAWLRSIANMESHDLTIPSDWMN